MAGNETFDYVIVGAGSAGCTLANRLSADPDISVLLLEVGPMDHDWIWKIHMPAALSQVLANDTYNWYYESEPEPYLDGRRIYCPRGRVVGGSSSINGMIYIRGHALDYERWAQSGLEGWTYGDCLPYFRKAETRAKGGDDYRGGSGPLLVSTGACANPLFKAWIEAGQQAGYAYTDDVNGYRQEGIGPFDMTVHEGRRWSAARAYLHPARKRDNLTLKVRAMTNRVLFEGRKAVGVEYVERGQAARARAGREVILCGGAINSPQILQLSGIGNADALRGHGIEVVQDLPGVGENLQDHTEIFVQYECTQPVSIYPLTKPWNKVRVGVQWILFKTGPCASNQFEAGGFIRTRAGIEHPDIQYHFLPIAMNYDGASMQDDHGFQVHLGPMRPTSKGHVRIRSANPRDYPEILFNYMETESDRRVMRDGLSLTREIVAQKAFDPFRGRELAPGPEVQEDDDIDAYVRKVMECAYHPSCTCKMGIENDGMAVVDAEARVYGIEALRVVDASIMPSIVSGNLNAPTIMIAEKLADRILGNAPLPRQDVPVWVHPEWETKQR